MVAEMMRNDGNDFTYNIPLASKGQLNKWNHQCYLYKPGVIYIYEEKKGFQSNYCSLTIEPLMPVLHGHRSLYHINIQRSPPVPAWFHRGFPRYYHKEKAKKTIIEKRTRPTVCAGVSDRMCLGIL